MTPRVHQVFTELHDERQLDSKNVFMYKGKAIRRILTASKAACRRAGISNLRVHDFRHTATTNLRRAGVDKMHRRYNTIDPADLHQAAAKLHLFKANTVITLGR
jgi:integrase